MEKSNSDNTSDWAQTVTQSQISKNKKLSDFLTAFKNRTKERKGPGPNNLKIDAAVANRFTKGNYESYSFLVTSNPQNKSGNMQNVFLTLNVKGGYDAYLVDFGMPQKEFMQLDEKAVNQAKIVFEPLPGFDVGGQKVKELELCFQKVVWDPNMFCVVRNLFPHSDECGGYKVIAEQCIPVGGSGVGGGPNDGPIFQEPGNPGNDQPNPNEPDHGDHSNNPGNPPPHGNSGGVNENNDSGDTVILAPIPLKTVLFYHLQPSTQVEIDKFNDYVTTADEGLQKALIDLFLSDTDYTNLNQFVWGVLKYNNDHKGEMGIDDFLDEALKIKNGLHGAKFDRINELNNLVKQNPWALIDPCAQQNGMDSQAYLDLYNHEMPYNTSTKLDHCLS